MKRPGCFLLAVFLALVIGGGQELYTGMKNGSMIEVGIVEFEANKPDAKWLQIDGGKLQVLDAAFSQGRFDKSAKEVFIPYVPKDADDEDRKVHVLLKTKNPDILRFIEESREMEEKLGPDATEQQQAELAIEIVAKLVKSVEIDRPINGLVEFGINSNSKETEKLRSLFPRLAEDFVVLQDGKKPEFGLGLFMLLAGCAVGYFIFRPRKASPVQPPPLPGA